MDDHTHHTIPLTRYAWLSIAAAIVTILLKFSAYYITGSVGLLSDALESLVNLAAAIVALIALNLVGHPPNDEFTFGYSKVEYFASGFEGGMILLAAAAIVFTAIPRLIQPVPLEQLGLGLVISVIASMINLGVALVLLRAAEISFHHPRSGRQTSHDRCLDVFKVNAVPTGLILIKAKVLQTMEPPWFAVQWLEGVKFMGPDIYFCEKAT